MNKKEVSEIKKQFNPKKCAITTLRGCYVDAEKNIKTTINKQFLGLPQEQMFKYFEVFKKTLSGKLEKNLLNLSFTTDEELNGDSHKMLCELLNCRLKNDDLVNAFYNKVIENYAYGENYYIVLMHAAYDVPGQSTDGSTMDDCSETVYNHIICSICPVNLSKSGLHYNITENDIEENIQDWMVEAPMNGFLFPAFNDRMEDIHNVLYYTKKSDSLQTEFLRNVVGTELPLSAKEQTQDFQEIIINTLGNECDFDTIKEIHDNINEYVENHAGIDSEAVGFDKGGLRKILEQSNLTDEQLQIFDENFDKCINENDRIPFLAAENVKNSSFEITFPDIKIKVTPNRSDLIQSKKIDGKRYLMIELHEGFEVNGIPIK